MADGSIRNLTAEEKSALVDLPVGARAFRLASLTSQSIGRKKGPGASSWFDVEIDGKSFDPGMSSAVEDQRGRHGAIARRRPAYAKRQHPQLRALP